MALPRQQSSNLPSPKTSIIGRDHEIKAVVAAFDQHAHRLITLTGRAVSARRRLLSLPGRLWKQSLPMVCISSAGRRRRLEGLAL